MKAAYFCFCMALLSPAMGWAQNVPVSISAVGKGDYNPVDAREAAKYLDVVKINCLPEIGVLQVNAYDFKVGAQNQEAFYLEKEQRETLLENKRIYHFQESSPKNVERVCVINGHKVLVKLEATSCFENKEEINSLDRGLTYPQDCLGAAVSIKVDDALWVNNLDLQNSRDFKKIGSLEVRQGGYNDMEGHLSLGINFSSGRENLPINVKHPNAQIKSDIVYSLWYPEKNFSEGMVINDDNFWGNF